MIDEQILVDAGLYPDRDAVVRDAIQSLLREKPELRVEIAIHRYQTEDISLALAAHLAGISFDRMRETLVRRGIPLRLGPATEEEARAEIDAMARILRKDRAS